MLRNKTTQWLLLAIAVCESARAGTLLLNDGRAIDGDVVKVSSVAEDALNPSGGAGELKVTPIVLVDDGLRRVYVNNIHVKQVLDIERERKVKIRIWQAVADSGSNLGRVGRAI